MAANAPSAPNNHVAPTNTESNSAAVGTSSRNCRPLAGAGLTTISVGAGTGSGVVVGLVTRSGVMGAGFGLAFLVGLLSSSPNNCGVTCALRSNAMPAIFKRWRTVESEISLRCAYCSKVSFIAPINYAQLAFCIAVLRVANVSAIIFAMQTFFAR